MKYTFPFSFIAAGFLSPALLIKAAARQLSAQVEWRRNELRHIWLKT
jgi:hypothetical protein